MELKKELIERIKKYMLEDVDNRREICSIYKDRALLKEIISYLADPFVGKVDYVAAPESIGFILGSMMADALDVGFIPIRNGHVAIVHEEEAVKGSYIDHRDRVRTLQVRKDPAFVQSRILFVDDWIETAATMQACITVIEELQGTVVGVAAIGVESNPATSSMTESGYIRHIV